MSRTSSPRRRLRSVAVVAAAGALVLGTGVAAVAAGGVPGPTRAAPAAAYHPPAPAGTTAHETRLSFPGTPGYAGRYTWQPVSQYDPTVPGSEAASAIYLDPADYPPGSVFFVRVTTGSTEQDTANGACLRLYDATVQRPVAGSRLCRSVPASTVRSYHVDDAAPFAPATGEHAYVLQGLLSDPGDDVLVAHAELVVRWQE